MSKKKILIAPLNWGLGHATRCIPIINELIDHNFEPVIASDGAALSLLKKEFPGLDSYKLPGYNITYSINGAFFGLKMALQAPHIVKTISAEKKLTEELVATANLDGIISDNRWGVRSSRIPSAIITHQVRVISGAATPLNTKIHQHLLKKFDECWVPDNAHPPFLSGKMGHVTNFGIPMKYLGILSRFEREEAEALYDLTIVLSGPEPQRSLLEEKLLHELRHYDKKILMIQGLVEARQTRTEKGNITVCNYLTSKQLQDELNRSKLVISRPGYTSLMDYVKLRTRVFLIPTPGQYEQEYLAKYLRKHKLATGCLQDSFNSQKLKEIDDFEGLGSFDGFTAFGDAFALFKGK